MFSGLWAAVVVQGVALIMIIEFLSFPPFCDVTVDAY